MNPLTRELLCRRRNFNILHFTGNMSVIEMQLQEEILVILSYFKLYINKFKHKKTLTDDIILKFATTNPSKSVLIIIYNFVNVDGG